MKSELLIVGTSGQAKEAAQLARQMDPGRERWHQISYVAERQAEIDRELPYGCVRYWDAQLAALSEPRDIVIGVGHPIVRNRLSAKLRQNSFFAFPNLIHPAVEIDQGVVRIGQGNMICKGVVITCDVVIGDFNLLNWNVTIGHDSRIGSHCVVNPGTNVSGNVDIGDDCLLGTGCQIRQNTRIAPRSVIGASALVLADITEAGTYVGVPARRLK